MSKECPPVLNPHRLESFIEPPKASENCSSTGWKALGIIALALIVNASSVFI